MFLLIPLLLTFARAEDVRENFPPGNYHVSGTLYADTSTGMNSQRCQVGDKSSVVVVTSDQKALEREYCHFRMTLSERDFCRTHVRGLRLIKVRIEPSAIVQVSNRDVPPCNLKADSTYFLRGDELESVLQKDGEPPTNEAKHPTQGTG